MFRRSQGAAMELPGAADRDCTWNGSLLLGTRAFPGNRRQISSEQNISSVNHSYAPTNSINMAIMNALVAAGGYVDARRW